MDVEYIRHLEEPNQIFSRFFSPFENLIWNEIPIEQKNVAFFYYWASKEAYLKARGEGFIKEIDKFDVFLNPRDPSYQGNIRISDESSDWFLQTFAPCKKYAAALVAEGIKCNPKFWKWEF